MIRILKKILILGVVPLFLIALWIISSIIFDTRSNLLSLKTNYDDKEAGVSSFDELHRDEAVNLKIKANENNLGIIAVRFHTFNRINEDVVLFRIKEQNKRNWYYEHEYRTDQFQWDQFFTFGFPIIIDSKDKIYEIEIKSLKGEYNNAVAISKIYPQVQAVYSFDRNFLIKNRQELFNFVFKKTINSFSEIAFVLNSFVYLFPFAFYLYVILNLALKNKYKFFLLGVYTLILIMYVIFVPHINRDIHLIFLIFWLITVFMLKLESSVSFLYALLFLSVSPIFILFKYENIAEKTAIFVYLFILSATVQLIYEHFKKPKDRIDYLFIATGIKKYFLSIYKKVIHSKIYFSFLKFFADTRRSTIQYFNINRKSKKGYFLWILRMIPVFIILVFVLNKSSVIVVGVENYFMDSIFKNKDAVGRNIFIEDVQPGIVRIGDKVMLKGDGFSKNSGNFASIVSSQGRIVPDFTADNKFIFTIPLDWKKGKTNIWLENEDIKSNNVEIRVFDRLGDYTFEDFEYYMQIKYLSEEARYINEFRNYKAGKRVVGEVFKFLL